MAKHKRRNQHPSVAIVTGGGSGIGRATAIRLSRDGFAVAIIGRRAERLKSKRGEKLFPFQCDVADNEQVMRTVSKIETDLARIDVLFNCAGVYREVPITETTPDAIDYMIGINLIGTINMTTACVPALRKSRGTIINMSSALSVRPYPRTSLYCASKGGVESYTRAVASELGQFGVRANVVSPGFVRSEVMGVDGAELERMLEEWGKKFALGRSGEPEDIAGLVSFLASPDAAWMTGATIPIEGGKLVA